MKLVLMLIACLFSLEASATYLKTSLSGLDVSQDPAEEVIVMATSGDVLWAPPRKTKLISTLKLAIKTQQLIELDVSANSTIRSARLLSEKSAPPLMDESFKDSVLQDYEPTQFSTMQEMKEAFATMDRGTRSRSQCYNRAYVWGHDLWRDRGVNSMKLFLFFTTKYIREFRYKWWFHVSPMSYVGQDEYVMDRRFTKNPLLPQSWTNIFMHNNSVCKSVTSYFDYHKDDPTEYCFLIRSTMFYYGPSSIKRRDQGYQKTEYNRATLRAARQQAFY
jgi:hypothetical protein